MNLKSTVQSGRLSDWNHHSFEPICDDGGLPLLPASDSLPRGASDHYPGHHLHPPRAGLAETPEHPGVTPVRTGNREDGYSLRKAEAVPLALGFWLPDPGPRPGDPGGGAGQHRAAQPQRPARPHHNQPRRRRPHPDEVLSLPWEKTRG